MKQERWREVERLFTAAAEHEPAKRAAFLAEACAGDESLRAEVESLLAQACPSSSFIEAPAIEKIARDLDSPSTDFPEEQPRKGE